MQVGLARGWEHINLEQELEKQGYSIRKLDPVDDRRRRDETNDGPSDKKFFPKRGTVASGAGPSSSGAKKGTAGADSSASGVGDATFSACNLGSADAVSVAGSAAAIASPTSIRNP